MEILERYKEETFQVDDKESEISTEIKSAVIEEKNLKEEVVANKREQIITEAMKYIWKQYKRGQANSKKYFDCSGFVNYILCKVFNKHTSEIPRSTKMIYQQYRKFRVAPNLAQDWDIVLFLNKSWVPYHGEILTDLNNQKKEISCIVSASRIEKAPDGTLYKPWVDKRTREYNTQKYLIIDTKKIMGLW